MSDINEISTEHENRINDENLHSSSMKVNPLSMPKLKGLEMESFIRKHK